DAVECVVARPQKLTRRARSLCRHVREGEQMREGAARRDAVNGPDEIRASSGGGSVKLAVRAEGELVVRTAAFGAVERMEDGKARAGLAHAEDDPAARARPSKLRRAEQGTVDDLDPPGRVTPERAVGGECEDGGEGAVARDSIEAAVRKRRAERRS